MANIDDVVIVVVTKTSVSISRAGFGVTMWMGQIDVALQAERFKLYSTAKDLTDAGFPVDHPAVLWATIHKSPDIKPAQFALGRRIPGAGETDEVEITVPDAGSWVATINGTPVTFVASGIDTIETIAAGLTLAINNAPLPVIAVQQAAPNDEKFDITHIVGGQSYTLVIAEPGSGMSTTVNTPEVAAEVWGTAYAAINTTAVNIQWFYLNIEDRDDATIKLAAAQVTTDEKIGVFQTSSDDMRTATLPNLGDDLKTLAYKRVQLFWKLDDLSLADSGMTGVAAAANLDAANGQITWNNKPLVGVATDDLTTSDKANIAAAGGSTYILIGGSGHTQTQSVQGEFMRVQTTIDWTKARIQEDVFGLIGNTPTKINLDATGIGSVLAKVKNRLDIGVTNGHYTSDFNPTADGPNPEDIDEDDKNKGILRDVIGVAKLAQAIRQVFVQIDLTV